MVESSHHDEELKGPQKADKTIKQSTTESEELPTGLDFSEKRRDTAANTADWSSKREVDQKDSEKNSDRLVTESAISNHKLNLPGKTFITMNTCTQTNSGTSSSEAASHDGFHAEGRQNNDDSVLDCMSEQHAEYAIIDQLGTGGMGIVYVARQQCLSRPVALKTLNERLEGRTDAEELFISEALVTGQLEHPNIVPIHELGKDRAGNLYLTMKLIQGQSWAELLSTSLTEIPEMTEGKWLLNQLEILIKICDAIAFAHSRGIIHRDLKPENVMIGEYGEVLVLDWGLALNVKLKGDEHTRVKTKHSGLSSAGTPRYMAPEQARGDMANIDYCTDVYLLGGMLYEILTGTAPHEASTVSESLNSAKREVQDPEIRAPERNFPRELADIALTALKLDPAERFRSVRQFQESIRHYFSHDASVRLSDEAAIIQAKIHEQDSVTSSECYNLYSQALSQCEQSLILWSGNREAKNLRTELRYQFATEALNRGDYGLAETQAAFIEQDHLNNNDQYDYIQETLHKHKINKSRTVLAILVIIFLSIGMYQIFSGLKEKAERELTRKEHQEALSQLCIDGWDAVRRGDSGNAFTIREEIHHSTYDNLQNIDNLRTHFDWACAVLLWSQSRWEELYLFLTENSPNFLESTEFRQMITTGDNKTLDTLPQVLQPFNTKSERNTATIWDLLQLSGNNLNIQSLNTLFELISEHEKKNNTLLPFHEYYTQMVVLRKAAIFACLRQKLGDSADDIKRRAQLSQSIIPFSCTKPPFGHSLMSPVPSRLSYSVLDDEQWIAFDSSNTPLQWDTLYIGDIPGTSTLVPIDDGTWLLSYYGQILRISGTDGSVLDRVPLAEEVHIMWPNPLDRSELNLVEFLSREKNSIHKIDIHHGIVQPPVYPAGALLASVSPLKIANSFVQARVKGTKIEGESDEQQNLGELEGSIEKDPTNPGLLLHYLILRKDMLTSEQIEKLKARILEITTPFFPFFIVQAGILAEQGGFRDLGDSLYTLAEKRFYELGGNPDLAFSSLNPATNLRMLADSLLQSGDKARAMELIDRGTRFSTFCEGDHLFYNHYQAWLAKEKLFEKAEKIGHYLSAALKSAGNGYFLFSGGLLLFVDIAFHLCLVALFFLGMTVLYLIVQTHSRVVRDLKMKGLDSAWKRCFAFINFPIERFKCLFLSYTTWTEKAFLIFLGLIIVFSLSFSSITMTTLLDEFYTKDLLIMNGYTESEGFIHTMEQTIIDEPANGAALRLLAEGCRFRGAPDRLQPLLERIVNGEQPDSISLNNFAVLLEESGQVNDALSYYKRAAKHDDEGAMVARINIARIHNQPDELATLLPQCAHRDRIRMIHEKAESPAWALCPLRDLITILRGKKIISSYYISHLFTSIDNGIDRFLDYIIVLGDSLNERTVLSLIFRLLLYAAMIICLMALVWFPFPQKNRFGFVRKTAKMSKHGTQFYTVSALQLLIPGIYDIRQHRFVLGILQPFVIMTVAIVSVLITHGSILQDHFSIFNPFEYRGGMVLTLNPHLEWLKELCLWIIAGVFTIHIIRMTGMSIFIRLKQTI